MARVEASSTFPVEREVRFTKACSMTDSRARVASVVASDNRYGLPWG